MFYIIITSLILYFLILNFLNNINKKTQNFNFEKFNKLENEEIIKNENEPLNVIEDKEFTNYTKTNSYEIHENIGKLKPIKKYKSNKQKGDEYEFFIAKIFKDDGYKIYMNGYNKGVKDEGIDIIAYKNNEILLIQCKNWNRSPKHKDIKAFVIDSDLYIKKYSKYNKNKFIRKIFVTSYEQMDYGVKCFLDKFSKENNIKIEYLIIPYNEIN